MTVQTSTNVAGFVGNGVTTSFPIAFKFNSSADLIVEATNTVTGVTTTLSLNSDYTVTGAGDENGGTIAFTAAPLSTETVKVTRHVDLLQLTDLRNQGKFYAEVHEDVFDKLVMIDQQQQTEINDANAKSNEAVATADLANEKSDQAVAKAGQNLVDMQAQYDAFEQGAALYVIGDYAAGLVISAYNQIFRKDGEFYRAAASLDLPYTLTGNWPTESINFVSVGDDVLRQELANGKSALVDSGVVGWRHRTVADRLNDTANVKDYGAIADGTLHPLSERYATLAEAQAVYPHATDLTQSVDWAAAQAALNSGTPRVHFPGMHYVFNEDLSRNTSVMVVGDGTTVLEFTASKRMTLAGSLTALPTLSTDVTTVSRSLAFSSTPELVAGDVLLAYNPTDYSWSPHRYYYRQGEFFRVHSVSSNTANIYGLPAENYSASAMEMYKVNGIRVTMQDLVIVGEESTEGAIVEIKFGVNVSISNVDAYGGSSYPIALICCYQVDVQCGGGRNNSPGDGDEYGLMVANSQRVTISGGDHAASRHAIALGGGNFTGAVPCRDIYINNMSLIGSSAGIGAADMHGNVDRVVYNNCHITHAHMSGRDVTLRGCIIYQRTALSDGMAVYGSEVVGGTYLVEGCTLITAGNLEAWGALSLSMVHPLKYDLNLVVRGLIVKGGAGGSLARLVKISVANGETKKCNVDVRGVRCELTQALCVLYIRCDENPAQTVVSDGHIVDDIYGPVGMYLIYPAGGALAGIPTREMSQRGYVDITTTASTTAIATGQNFRHPYSKMPSAQISFSDPAGAALSTVGGQPASGVIYSASPTQLRPSIVAPANMTAGVAVRLHWEAGIKEV